MSLKLATGLSLAKPTGSRLACTGDPGTGDDLLYSQAGVPTLDLRFASSKSLNDNVSGQNLIDFTRGGNGIGTNVGSDGLIKNSAVNLLTYSEDFENIAWQTTNPGEVTLITGVADPAGGNNATTLYHDSGDTGWLRRIISGTSGQPYILSFWARRRAGTGNLLAVVGDNVNQTINEVTSSWQRFSIVNTPTSSTVRVYLKVDDTGDQFDIWGAQLEQSSIVGEYVKTTSSISGAPRFDHDPETGESLGLLIEEQRTNGIRNNTMVGAVAGTPGTLPTNWTQTTGSGLTSQVVAVGTQSGINYIDVRVSGTAGDTSGWSLAFDGNTQIVASIGQSWTGSVYVALVGGSLTGTDNQFFRVVERSGAGSYLGESNTAWNTISSSFGPSSRISVTRPSMGASAGYVQSGLYFFTTIGAAIDITLRIGLPQLEQGAFATSVIPTTSAAVTRNADVALITGANFSSWYRQDEGTVFAEYNPLTSIPPTNQAIITIESTANNGFRLYQQGANGRPLGQWQNPAGLQANFPFTALNFQAGVTSKVAAAYADADFAGASSLEPGNTAQVTTGVVPIGLTSAGIGSRSSNSTFFANGRISRLSFFDRRLPNATLEVITG